MSTSVLVLPNSTSHIALDTVACTIQVGYELLQKQEIATTKPIGYWSRSLTEAVRNIDTIQRECLGVVRIILFLRPYLKRMKLTARTSHDSIKWILSLPESTNKFAGWRLRLSELTFDIVHKAGIKREAADALSRLPTCEKRNVSIIDDLLLLAIDRMHNHGNTKISLISNTEDGVLPPENDNTKVSHDTAPSRTDSWWEKRKTHIKKLQLYK